MRKSYPSLILFILSVICCGSIRAAATRDEPQEADEPDKYTYVETLMYTALPELVQKTLTDKHVQRGDILKIDKVLNRKGQVYFRIRLKMLNKDQTVYIDESGYLLKAHGKERKTKHENRGKIFQSRKEKQKKK